ncbi:hypothetical protein J4214_04405 [Candidatus Woesearchaeota archaeon]|nr:hypothetical protein [Candidatus Woesearchaeota archaeon]
MGLLLFLKLKLNLTEEEKQSLYQRRQEIDESIKQNKTDLEEFRSNHDFWLRINGNLKIN